jgi:hypothetical protein
MAGGNSSGTVEFAGQTTGIFMRLRSVAISVFALVVSGLSGVRAETPITPLSPVTAVLQAVSGTPDGWTRNMDGSYKHPASGVLCPTEFKSFQFDGFVAPSTQDSNVLGICHYKDGSGRFGTIRVRQPGPVTDPDGSVAANDKALLATDGDAPPMLMRTSTDRKTGGARLTVTIARNGFLVDCSVMQIEHNTPRGDFPLYCTTIPANH